MSIKSCVDELDQINSEILRNNIRNKNLRLRAKELEDEIGEYMVEKGLPGLKYKGKAVMLQTKESRPPKKPKEKSASILSLLEEWGVSDSASAYTKLMDVQKRSPVSKQKIKFKKIT